MALTLIANLDPGLQCRNTLNAVIDLVGANHPWTSGSIPYTDASADYAQDNANFFWDATNKLLTSGNGFKIKGTTSGIVTLNTKAVAGTWTMTLPDTAGTSGYVLSTNGSGVTSWIAGGGGGGGTTILSGSGAPADALGSVGDYYVDEDGNQVYGPKGTAGIGYGPDQYAIPPSLAPTSGLNGGSYELGNHVTVAVDGQIVAVRYLRDVATSQVARKVNVWTTGGTLLASGIVANDGGGSGWKQITLTTPVILTAGSTVIVSVGNADQYRRTDSASYPISSGGDVSIIASSYGAGADTFPAFTYTSNWFTDAVFQAEVATSAWPMAVDGDVMQVGGTVTGATANGVLFADVSGDLAQDATFFWDATLEDLHIGGAYYVNAARAIYVVPNVTENNWFEGNAGNQTMSGYGNFGTGDLALSSLTTGYDNVALGTNAAKNTTSGYQNFALGSFAMLNNVSNPNNVAIGTFAMTNLGRLGAGGGGSGGNVAIGFGAMNQIEIGGSNVVIGFSGLSNAAAPTVVEFNTIIGNSAGGNLGVGGGSGIRYNTFLGNNAGRLFNGGSSANTVLGGYQGVAAVVNDSVAITNGTGQYVLLDWNITTSLKWSMAFDPALGVPTGLHIYGYQNALGATSNYERVILDWTATGGIFTIKSEAGGSGTQRNIAISGFPKAGAPAAGDLPSGTFSVIDDTSGGATWLVFNKAGTIRKVQLT